MNNLVAPDSQGKILTNENNEKTFHVHCRHCPYKEPVTRMYGWRRCRLEMHLVFDDLHHNKLSKIVGIFIMICIFLSTVLFVVETLDSLQPYIEYFETFEMVLVIIFTIEYVLRLLCARNPIFFIFSLFNLIDLAAILPFYVQLTTESTTDLRVLRIIRLARVFRLFKLSKYSAYMQLLQTALEKSSDALGLLIFFVMIAVVIFSTMAYYAEKGTWDAARLEFVRSNGDASPFSSIPAVMYWCITTMTTVGYGDIFPIDPAGKVVALCTMLLGILILALPITILGNNFQDVYVLEQKIKGNERPLSKSKNVAKLKLLSQDLKDNRRQLSKVLHQLGYLLQTRSKNQDFFQIWTTLDYTAISTLQKTEEYIDSLAATADEFQKQENLVDVQVTE